MSHRIRCSEIWGGIRGDEIEADTSGIRASLFSRAAEGGKGGDIYYFSVCGSDLLTRIAIADVMGHGEQVSKTSQWLYDSLKANMNSADGTQVLADLNLAAVEYGYQAMATAAVAAFYRADNKFYCSYAGHHEILVKRRHESNWGPLAPERKGDGLVGLMLGVDEHAVYKQSSAPFQAGDQVFAYTDGVIEAFNQSQEQFGIDRLLCALQMTTGEIGDIRRRVLDAILDHTGGHLEHDDVTFMAVEIVG